MAKGLELRVKTVDLETGTIHIAILNEFQALEEGINAGDRVRIEHNRKKINAIVDFAEVTIKEGEIGLFEDVWKGFNIKSGSIVRVFQVPNPVSISYIKKKIEGNPLNRDEIFAIIGDVVNNKLSEIELSAFVTACQIHELSEEETYNLTCAVVETGETLHLKDKIIADKHSLGGIAGNRTTMVIVPIIASYGITIPKTSSRSITSPAGTADTMEVLADIEFPAKELERKVRKVGATIVFGGTVNLAAADDKLIRIRHPLHLDPIGLMLASILAKKKAVGSTHVLIDIPIGEEAKVVSMGEAEVLGKKFVKLGKKLGMKVDFVITDGSAPIGNGIGPVLEARDVLMVLQQHKNRPLDLEKKCIDLSGELLEMIGKAKMGKGKEMAAEALRNGNAFRKMKEIIKNQNGNPNIQFMDLRPAKLSHNIRAAKSGIVKGISNKAIVSLGRTAGAPAVREAGIYLSKQVGERVKKGDILFTIYSKSKEKLNRCAKMVKEMNIYKIGK